MVPWCFRFNEKNQTEVYYHGIKIQGIRSANIKAEVGEVDVTSATSPWVNTEMSRPTVIVNLEIISSKAEEVPILGESVKDQFYSAYLHKIATLEDENKKISRTLEGVRTGNSNLMNEIRNLKIRNQKLKSVLKSILNETISDGASS